MASSLKVFLLLLLPLFVTLPFSSEARRWEKKTHLHLYFHERNSGPNSTTAVVVPRNTAPFEFGSIEILDNELREGAEPNSKLVGRIQGFVAAVSKVEYAYLFPANFVFTEGRYKGSSLAVFGPAVLESPTRDWSIIGGTGRFRNARGYIHGKKLKYEGGFLLLELDIYVVSPFYISSETGPTATEDSGDHHTHATQTPVEVDPNALTVVEGDSEEALNYEE